VDDFFLECVLIFEGVNSEQGFYRVDPLVADFLNILVNLRKKPTVKVRALGDPRGNGLDPFSTEIPSFSFAQTKNCPCFADFLHPNAFQNHDLFD
jgi:hypothetical protein